MSSHHTSQEERKPAIQGVAVKKTRIRTILKNNDTICVRILKTHPIEQVMKYRQSIEKMIKH